MNDFFCFFPSLFLAAGRFSGAWLFYWAASRHRLFFYWPVSRCAFGRESVRPDLPLPGWEATGRHSRAGVGEELAEGWEISVQVVGFWWFDVRGLDRFIHYSIIAFTIKCVYVCMCNKKYCCLS